MDLESIGGDNCISNGDITSTFDGHLHHSDVASSGDGGGSGDILGVSSRKDILEVLGDEPASRSENIMSLIVYIDKLKLSSAYH